MAKNIEKFVKQKQELSELSNEEATYVKGGIVEQEIAPEEQGGGCPEPTPQQVFSCVSKSENLRLRVEIKK